MSYWNLEGLLSEEKLDKFIERNRVSFHLFFIDDLCDLYSKTVDYTRSEVLDIRSHEFTTSPDIYEKTGLYKIIWDSEYDSKILVGNTDILYFYDYNLEYSEDYDYEHEEYGYYITSLGNLDKTKVLNSKLTYNILIGTNNIVIDKDVLKSFIADSNSFMNHYYYCHDFDLKCLIKYLNELNLDSKIETITIGFNRLDIFDEVHYDKTMMELSKYVNKINLELTYENLIEFLTYKNIEKLIEIIKKYNIKFVISEEDVRNGIVISSLIDTLYVIKSNMVKK